jgi:uncharacterized protein (TIGR02597 family)
VPTEKQQQMTILKSTTVIAALASFVVWSAITHAQNVVTPPVGFYKITITNTFSGNAFTPIGMPLQRMKADQGLISGASAVSSNTIKDASKNWNTNWWDPNALHYVEFKTGPATGRFFAIETNTSDTLHLAVGNENLQTLGVANGQRYVVRPFWRIRDIFGDVTNTPLQAANSVGAADNVFILDENQAFKTIFPRSGDGNWVMFGVGIANNLPILPDEGLMVFRRTGAVTNIVLVGEVKTTNHVTVLDQGFNLVANAFPAGVTVSNSQLLASSTGFKGGSNVNNADNLFVWDASIQGWRTVFFRTGDSNWVMFGIAVTNSLVLNPGDGFLIQNKTAGGKWNRPLPYNP